MENNYKYIEIIGKNEKIKKEREKSRKKEKNLERKEKIGKIGVNKEKF